MNLEDDDVFDEFMRQKLHKIHPEFDEKAWLSLEERLPKPQRSLFMLRKIAGIAAAALLLGAGVIYTLNHQWTAPNPEHHTTQGDFSGLLKKQENTTKYQEKDTRNQKETITSKELYEDTLQHQSASTLNEAPLSEEQPITQSILDQEAQREKQITTGSNPPNLGQLQKEMIAGVENSIPQLASNLKNTALPVENMPEVLFPVELTEANQPKKKADDIPSLYTRRPRWQVGVGMSSEVALAPRYSTRTNDWYGAISVHAERLISSKFRVGLGLNYFQKFQNIDKNFKQSVRTQTVSLGENTRISQLTIEKERGAKIERLEVPLELKFMSGASPRWRLFAASGLTFGVNLKEKQIYESENIFIDTNSGELLGSNNSFTSDEKDFGVNLSWNLSAGLEYSLSKHTHVQVMPYFKYALGDTQSKSRQSQTYGLRTVIFYRW